MALDLHAHLSSFQVLNKIFGITVINQDNLHPLEWNNRAWLKSSLKTYQIWFNSDYGIHDFAE